MNEERYLALDGMRGIAAIAVALMHARVAALHGYLAVDFFFLLSGFVIAKSYEPKLASGEISLAYYARVRLERLYPMLFLGGVLGVTVFVAGWSHYQPAGTADLTLAVVSQFLLVPGLASTSALFAFNNPQWSIMWEMAANFFHALGLRRLTNRALMAIAAVSVVSLAWLAFRLPSLSTGWSTDNWIDGLPRVGFGFFAGILLHRTREIWLRFVPSVNFIIPALLFLVLVSIPPQVLSAGRAFAIYDLVLVVLVFPPLVMLSVKAVAGSAARALGLLSYPLYAINEPVLSALELAGFGYAAKSAVLLALVATAWAIGRWIDEPLTDWFRRQRRKSAAQPIMTAF